MPVGNNCRKVVVEIAKHEEETEVWLEEAKAQEDLFKSDPELDRKIDEAAKDWEESSLEHDEIRMSVEDWFEDFDKQTKELEDDYERRLKKIKTWREEQEREIR